MRAHLFFQTAASRVRDREYEHVATLDVAAAPVPAMLDEVRATATSGEADWRENPTVAWAVDGDLRSFADGDLVVLEDAAARSAYEGSASGWALCSTATVTRTGPRAWACDACGGSTAGEYYMVADELWLEATGGCDGHLCIGCLEARLGRRLGPDDFTDDVANVWPRMRPDARAAAPEASLLHFPLRDDDVPIYWSARFLDRLGLGPRYARYRRGYRSSA